MGTSATRSRHHSCTYWSLFSDYFPATKDIVKTKLEEIGNVRNALAHFRPLKPDDVQVVRQNANQVLSRVEETLVKLVDLGAVVPTNTPDPWYTALRTLAAPHVNVTFQQSDDEPWVFLSLTYDCPQPAAPTLYQTYRAYRVLTILTPAMLKVSPALRDNTIFASEFVPWTMAVGGAHPDLSKKVTFSFSRDTLAAMHAQIKPELESLLRRITDETALIHEDNLARGEFVRTVTVTASREKDQARWLVTTANLYSPSAAGDPVEFWAGAPFFGADFLTDTESFPWMPVSISKFTLPF